MACNTTNEKLIKAQIVYGERGKEVRRGYVYSIVSVRGSQRVHRGRDDERSRTVVTNQTAVYVKAQPAKCSYPFNLVPPRIGSGLIGLSSHVSSGYCAASSHPRTHRKEESS